MFAAVARQSGESSGGGAAARLLALVKGELLPSLGR